MPEDEEEHEYRDVETEQGTEEDEHEHAQAQTSAQDHEHAGYIEELRSLREEVTRLAGRVAALQSEISARRKREAEPGSDHFYFRRILKD